VRGRKGEGWAGESTSYLSPPDSHLSRRAFHLTGRVSGSTTCFAWHVTQRSLVSVVLAATSFRLVAPHRVQIHSAVVAGLLIVLCRSSSGGQLLQRPADELRRLSRSTCRECGAHGIVRGRYPVAQAHQGLDRIL
jgi:hypothetical protein